MSATVTSLGSPPPYLLPDVPTPRERRLNARRDDAYFMPGACEFSDDRDLENARWLVRQMKLFPGLWEPIAEAAGRSYCGHGRRGFEDGDWAHVFAVFTMSSTAYIAEFYDAEQESTLWSEAGFPSVPSYQSVYENFRRIEKCAEVIEAVGYRLVRIAIAADDRVARHWADDATAYQSASLMEHCCPDAATCRAAGGTAQYVERASNETIQAERHKEQAGVEPGGEEPDPKKDEYDVEPLKEGDPHAELLADERYRYQWLGPKGKRHLYRTLDKNAGTRMYNGPGRKRKVWHGGLMMAAIDHFTGGLLGTHHFAADEMEYDHYPTLYEKVAAGVGRPPEAVTTDKGQHTKELFEFNTRHGTAFIVPWRQPYRGMDRKDMATDEFDVHGVPRCKYCGGAGTMRTDEGRAVRQTLGLYFARRQPRLRFVCSLGTTLACQTRSQSIACETEWRMLLPLGLTDNKLYYELKAAHQNKEKTFYCMRSRYKLAGNDIGSRPRIRAQSHKELRAAFALLLDWFRICLRQGWLTVPGHTRLNTATVQRRSDNGWLNRVLNSRRRKGVLKPAGSYAAAAGLLDDDVGRDPPDPDLHPRLSDEVTL